MQKTSSIFFIYPSIYPYDDLMKKWVATVKLQPIDLTGRGERIRTSYEFDNISNSIKPYFSCCSTAKASCIDDTAARFNIPVQIISAILKIESNTVPVLPPCRSSTPVLPFQHPRHQQQKWTAK